MDLSFKIQSESEINKLKTQSISKKNKIKSY